MLSITLPERRITLVTEQYPELKISRIYIMSINAIQTYKIMIRAGKLVYNDSVIRLNRRIRMFPASLICGMLGFSKKEYLDDGESSVQ